MLVHRLSSLVIGVLSLWPDGRKYLKRDCCFLSRHLQLIIIYLSPFHWTLCSLTARLSKSCGLNKENSATCQFRYFVSPRDVWVRHRIALSCIQSQPTLRDLRWQDSNNLLHRSLVIYAYHNKCGAFVPFCPVICNSQKGAHALVV
jgi:hypothetical protein